MFNNEPASLKIRQKHIEGEIIEESQKV